MPTYHTLKRKLIGQFVDKRLYNRGTRNSLCSTDIKIPVLGHMLKIPNWISLTWIYIKTWSWWLVGPALLTGWALKSSEPYKAMAPKDPWALLNLWGPVRPQDCRHHNEAQWAVHESQWKVHQGQRAVHQEWTAACCHWATVWSLLILPILYSTFTIY